MFRFIEETGGSKGRFAERVRASGIIIPSSVTAQKVARWAQVVCVGPKAAEAGLNPGDYILIEALMWMEGTTFEGEKLWKTDDSKIMAVTNDFASCQPQSL
jgi:co-chaperonin GroES (HSP10)